MRVAVREFTDPGEFGDALRPSRVELIPTAPGAFSGAIIAVELARVRLQRLEQSLPGITHVQDTPDRIHLGFLPDEEAPPITADGVRIGPDTVLQSGSLAGSSRYTAGGFRWAMISIDSNEAAALAADRQATLLLAEPSRALVPAGSAIQRLRHLHATAVRLARWHPAFFMLPAIAQEFERSLIQAAVACLAGGEPQLSNLTRLRHAMLIQRFRDLLDDSLDRPLSVAQLCAVLGVPHRTLSYCCRNVLGMSPKRYSYLRRMHQARRLLREADQNTTTVTQVATRYGFWEFGRFAAQYKGLFGETPSTTLRRVWHPVPCLGRA